MPFRALERMLSPERIHQRAGRVGYAVPALQERPTPSEEGPFLVTNMRSQFVSTRVSREGLVRYAFSEVPPENDDEILVKIHETILAQPNWSNRCTSIVEAMAFLRQQSLEPRTIVLPTQWLPEIDPGIEIEGAKTLMSHQGYVTKLDDVQVLVADLPLEKALVAAAPTLTGVYTRISDFLGILLLRADRSIVAVTRGVDE